MFHLHSTACHGICQVFVQNTSCICPQTRALILCISLSLTILFSTFYSGNFTVKLFCIVPFLAFVSICKLYWIDESVQNVKRRNEFGGDWEPEVLRLSLCEECCCLHLCFSMLQTWLHPGILKASRLWRSHAGGKSF